MTGRQPVTRTNLILKSIKMKTLKNLNQIYRLAEGHQVTAQELINGRCYLGKKGWQNVVLSPELRANFISIVCNILGGHERTKNNIANTLRYSRPQHWGLSRILLSKYGKDAKFSYCAGQDYVWEINEIRKALK